MKQFIFLLVTTLSFQVSNAQFQYLSPVAGATLVNVEHNIIIREGHYIDPAFLKENLFTIHGSKSGDHEFKMVLCADRKTIILTPASYFGYDEEVTVTVKSDLRTSAGKIKTSYSFSFTTHREYSAKEKQRIQDAPGTARQQLLEEAGFDANAMNEAETRSAIAGGYQVTVNTAPSPGLIFFDSFNGFGTGSIYDGRHIITSSGDSVYSSPGQHDLTGDWDLNPDGHLGYENVDSGWYDLMDSGYHVIDHYIPANGYITNGHEFTRYTNGHVFLLADEIQMMNLTVYNSTYNSNAAVTWNVVQEFDEDKNLVFEWRAADHVVITESNQNLHSSTVDAVHTNSIDLDLDGNIIISNRSLSQVMKIDHNTGAYIWRLGGTMNGFTFINDPDKISFQHDARILSNGHLTLFDNGNTHPSHHSIAKEYELDVVNHTATLVWSYGVLNSSGGFAYYSAMGSVQRLPNGNTLIDGGLDFSSTQPNLIEVTATGQVVWQLVLDNSTSLISYRAHRYEWNPCAPVNPLGIKVKKITASTAKVIWQAVNNAASYDVQYRRVGKLDWKVKNTSGTGKKLINLLAAKSYEFQVRVHCTNGFTSDWCAIDTFTTAAVKLLMAEEKETTSTLQVHPNPVSDVLTLEWNCDEDASAAVSVYDVSGKLMLTSSRFNAAEETLQLNVSSLLPGFYFAELNFGNSREMVQFMKQ